MIGDFCVGGLPYDVGKFANGAIHWVFTRFDHVESKIIHSFDIQTETFRELLLPKYEGGTVFLKLDTFGENLIILVEFGKFRFDFWVLRNMVLRRVGESCSQSHIMKMDL